jgi:hypothetical protein
MTETELELSFPAADPELRAMVEQALRERDGITVGKVRQVRTIDPLTLIEIVGTVVGLTDGLCDLRDRVRAYLEKRGKSAPALAVANAEGSKIALLEATDGEVGTVVSGSDPAPESEPDPGRSA